LIKGAGGDRDKEEQQAHPQQQDKEKVTNFPIFIALNPHPHFST
jgi:hypothetical protein